MEYGQSETRERNKGELSTWRTILLTPMERRNEEDIVISLHFVTIFAFQFPVRIVDEYENSRPPT